MTISRLAMCECSNYNCEWGTGLAEPYTMCPCCASMLEPTSEDYSLEIEEMFGELDEGY